MRFLCGCYGNPGWLLRCCYAVLGYSGWLVGYLGWLLRCCYAVARVPKVVAKMLLCGCYGTWGGC